MKKILSGNEAVARGVYEASVHFASAYPGTPSTEILQNISTYKDVYAEWAPNEKVALEAATLSELSFEATVLIAYTVVFAVLAKKRFVWYFICPSTL